MCSRRPYRVQNVTLHTNCCEFNNCNSHTSYFNLASRNEWNLKTKFKFPLLIITAMLNSI